MANFTFNISKGRAVELYNRVQTNDPAASRLSLVVVNTSATDATLKDLDTLSAVLADANTAEVTNTNYARIHLADTDLSAFTTDDTNDKNVLDAADQTWSAISAGDAWTDIIICYDPLGTNVDANMVPLSQHDFAVTPDGSDIVATIANFFEAS